MKILRLLMNIENKYIYDENGVYFKDMNKTKINWKAFENENGSSIMKLLAINARQKINVYHTNIENDNKH